MEIRAVALRAGPDAEVASMVTGTPEVWIQSCRDGAPGPDSSECEALRRADGAARERVALAINVRLSPALAILHFARGPRQSLDVQALLDGAGTAVDVADANRAFLGGADRGVLTPWVETAICAAESGSGSATVFGPREVRCRAFDSVCTRGRIDASETCCTGEHLLAGTLCGDGGRCDGAGQCVAPADVVAPVAAPIDWLHLFPNGYPSDALVPRLAADVVEVAEPPSGLPERSLEIRVPVDVEAIERHRAALAAGSLPGDEEAFDLPVLAIVPPEPARGRVTIVRSAEGAPLNLLAYDGPRGPRALVLCCRPETGNRSTRSS